MPSRVVRFVAGLAVAVMVAGGCDVASQQARPRPDLARSTASGITVARQHVAQTQDVRARRALSLLRVRIGSRRTSNIVRVGRGYEAATWVLPRRHEIVFWRDSSDGRHWRTLAHRRYPNLEGSSCHPQINAAAMRNAPHAVYIFYGCFTGDGVLTAEAFASGAHGWGVVEAAGSRRLASQGKGGTKRHPIYAAMYRSMAFHRGQLETVSGNYYFFPDAEDTRYPLVRQWVWSAGGLNRVQDSQFVAEPTAQPDARAQPVPAGRCPSDGTFTASFGARVNQHARYRPNEPLHLLVFPAATTYPASPTCIATVTANTPMTVYAVHVPPGRYSLRSHPVTHQRWITAPAWLLVADDLDGKSKLALWPHYAVKAGVSSYVVATSLNVDQIRAALGRPEPYSKADGWKPRHRPAVGTVTFHDGRLTALSLAAR